MKTIHSDLNNKSFVLPHNNNLETARICSVTGLRANDNCSSYMEYYLEGTSPTNYCDKHSNNSKVTPSTNENNSKVQEPTTSDIINTPEVVQQSPESTHSDNSANVISPETPVANTISQNNTISAENTSKDTTSNTLIDEEDNFISDDDTFEQ